MTPLRKDRKQQELRTHSRPRLIKDPKKIKKALVLQYRSEKVCKKHWFYSIGPKKYFKNNWFYKPTVANEIVEKPLVLL